jgi:hypothetical protein
MEARLQQRPYAQNLHQIHIRQQREQENRRRQIEEAQLENQITRSSPRLNRGVPPNRYGLIYYY